MELCEAGEENLKRTTAVVAVRRCITAVGTDSGIRRCAGRRPLYVCTWCGRTYLTETPVRWRLNMVCWRKTAGRAECITFHTIFFWVDQAIHHKPYHSEGWLSGAHKRTITKEKKTEEMSSATVPHLRHASYLPLLCFLFAFSTD